MSSIGTLGQRLVYAVVAIAVAAGFVMPSIVSAAQVTQRSIAISSASKGSENVTYEVQFTVDGAAGAFVVDFCGNTPLIGQTCTPAEDFTAAGADTATAGFEVTSATATRVIVEGEIDAAEEVSVQLTGINNPSVAGPLYARIVTYDTATNAAASTPENLTVNAVDQGGVAISITETFGVSGTVLESLTFCVSGEAIGPNCTNVTSPTLVLGEETFEGSDIYALQAGTLSEGDVHTQLTTNAAGGVTVRLKSTAEGCGGLMRAGAPEACDILPALDTGVDPLTGDARFGVRTADATPTAGATDGTLLPVELSLYNNSTFALNYVTGDEQGVTSEFGDLFLDTRGAPANNRNMVLTFGATVGNNTPAGTYSTDLSMIAVGYF